MAVRPFWRTDTVSLPANGTGTALFPVGAGDVERYRKLVYSSTGSFNIVNIRLSTGLQFTNASASDPIPNVQLALGQTGGNPVFEFQPPLEVQGSLSLIIDLADTSGAANTVRLTLVGELETAG